MTDEMVAELKSLPWQQIIDYGQSLDDLNGAQYKFLKGLVVELMIEKASGELVYVGEAHKDFDWPNHSASLELKSILSKGMYLTKKGVTTLRPKMTGIILSNSYGQNRKEVLDPGSVADVLLVIMRDGAYAVSKQTVLSNAKYSGDGWTLKPNSEDIVELSGHILPKTAYQTDLAQKIQDVIRNSLPEVDK